MVIYLVSSFGILLGTGPDPFIRERLAHSDVLILQLLLQLLARRLLKGETSYGKSRRNA